MYTEGNLIQIVVIIVFLILIYQNNKILKISNKNSLNDHELDMYKLHKAKEDLRLMQTIIGIVAIILFSIVIGLVLLSLYRMPR